MIRVAAVGDVHFDRNSRGRLAQFWPDLKGKADLLLIAGDLTQTGHEDEVRPLAEDLSECPVPVVTVLGNHDLHSDREKAIEDILTAKGVTVLESRTAVFKIKDVSVGIYGLKGFGGGFIGACCSDFGERETKAFVQHTKSLAAKLHEGLQSLRTHYKIVLMHYSPTPDTLFGEKKEIYPFLGSYLLGEAIDRAGANVVFHGHAHGGVETGRTLGGIPVRNVAQPVIRHAFNIYCLHELASEVGCGTAEAAPLQ